nr:hypothetical protein [uncultured Aminipila sp.]
MKKKTKILFVIAGVLTLTCGTALAAQVFYPGVDKAQKIGSELEMSATSLMDKNTTEYGFDSVAGDEAENNLVATVFDEKISGDYFMYRMRLYEVCDSENPAQDAWEEIKKEINEKTFAEDHRIMPSEEEIIENTNQMREVAKSTEESREISKALIESMGLTEDEYWNDFKPKYETPITLTRYNVSQYCTENNLPELDTSQVEYKVIDQDFFDNLGIKY